jgi:O-antigen ligase
MLVILALVFVFHRSVLNLLRDNTYVFHNSGSGYLERIKSSADISSDVSNLERLNRWVSGIRMFSDKPFTGFGPGTYQFTYIPYQDPALINRLSVKDPWHIPENSGGTAHSEYILDLSEMGLLGFIAFIVAISRWAWLAFQHSYKFKDRDRIVVQVAFTALSTYIFHAFFNNFLNTDKFAFLFWGLAAWMSAHYELNTGKQHGLLS